MSHLRDECNIMYSKINFENDKSGENLYSISIFQIKFQTHEYWDRDFCPKFF